METKNIKSTFEQHLESYKKSQLSLKKYCHNNQLSYNQFSYWLKKKETQSEKTLIPVHVKSVEQAKRSLCTLNLGQGVRLEIHDTQALTTILERFF